MMDAFDAECPRCKRLGPPATPPADTTAQQTPPPAPVVAKAATATQVRPPVAATEITPAATPPSRSPLSPLILIPVLCLVGVLLYFGYRQYKIHASMSKLMPLMMNVSIRTAKDMEYETNPSSITYKEIEDNLDTDIKKIDENIVTMKTIPSTFTAKTIDASIAYATACQELLRAQRYQTDKKVGTIVAVDVSDETKNSGFYDPVDDAVNLEKASNEYRDALKNTVDNVNTLKNAHENVAPLFEKKYLIDATALSEFGDSVSREYNIYK